MNAIAWTAAEATDGSLPLLLVHDGPEYAEYSSLVRLLDHLVEFGEVRPFRAVLLPPPLDRNEAYSASARYAHALVEDWLPQLEPYDGKPVLMGASLGALAALHVHFPIRMRSAGSSSSRGASSGGASTHRSPAIDASTGSRASSSRVFGGRSEVDRIPVTFTCGTAEENLGNNRAVAAALQRRAGRPCSSSTATRTTGSPGATRSIPTSPSCCFARGRD